MKLKPFILIILLFNFCFVAISLWILLPNSETEPLIFIKYIAITLIPSIVALYLLPKIALIPIQRIKRLLLTKNILEQDLTKEEQINFQEFLEIENHIIDCTQKFKELVQKKKIMALAFQSKQPILIIDENLKIVKANPAFCKDFGYSFEELIGQTPKLISSGLHKNEFWENFYKQLDADGHISEIVWNKTKNGNIFPFQVNINFTTDSMGNPTFFICNYFNIAKEVEKSKKLQKFAYSDALTGLYNRRFIEDELINTLSRAQRHKHHGAILFMDLNKFKSINDTLGHEVGDILLQNVAERLKKLTRLGELCCRLGGDEFLVLLPQLSSDIKKAEDEALEAAKRFQAFLSKPYKLKGLNLNIGVSIGIAIFPDKNKTPKEFLNIADQEMYKSKQKSDGKISIHRNN